MVKAFSVISAIAIFGFVSVHAGLLHDLLHHKDGDHNDAPYGSDDHWDGHDGHDGHGGYDGYDGHDGKDGHYGGDSHIPGYDGGWDNDAHTWGPPLFGSPDVQNPEPHPNWACMCFSDENTDRLCYKAGGLTGQLSGNHVCIVSEYSYGAFQHHCGGAHCTQLGG
ncbi:hypothetical protein EC973_001004 [Apophysomyces ossiformis]|uniref:Uncharacterized protein n=1 Tax=Apophysomyces ossiformis TaxID=679940 RepID=A0A8H7EV68_9FUNG|nr:hypothetical protein EC973_001004 [Apophysomyces ossiformis]